MGAAEQKGKLFECIDVDSKVSDSYLIRSMDKIQRKLLEEFWIEVVKQRYLNKTYKELPLENIEKDYLEFTKSKKLLV